MNLKIIVDNNLERLTGKLSRITYEKLNDKKKLQSISNNYFHFLTTNGDMVIIEIVDIIQDSNLLYLHQTAKDLLYADIDSINL